MAKFSFGTGWNFEFTIFHDLFSFINRLLLPGRTAQIHKFRGSTGSNSSKGVSPHTFYAWLTLTLLFAVNVSVISTHCYSSHHMVAVDKYWPLLLIAAFVDLGKWRSYFFNVSSGIGLLLHLRDITTYLQVLHVLVHFSSFCDTVLHPGSWEDTVLEIDFKHG